MKIAILGSAPSSQRGAPFGDASWEIWACSPGTYANLPRCDEFYELHRWEPGVIGKAETQKPWFSPEYVAWLRLQRRVWVADPAALADLRNAAEVPWRELVTRYGHYCWTSTVSYMLAMAIDKIIAARRVREDAQKAQDAAVEQSRTEGKPTPIPLAPGGVAPEPEAIGLWGVDMAANEELYSGQRWAAQQLLQVAVGLGIQIVVPPESDLLTPPPMYGVSEASHRHIKLLARQRELQSRVATTEQQIAALTQNLHFLRGALDDNDYHMKMWMFEGDTLGFDFGKFPGLDTVSGGVDKRHPAPPESTLGS